MCFVASYSLLDESQKMQKDACLIRSNMDEYHSVCWFSSISVSSNPSNEHGEGLSELPPLGFSS